jgi:hypothetical protein
MIKYFSLLGGIVIVIGSFLPWLTVNDGSGLVNVYALEGGDGVRTLITGASVILATFVARGPRRFNSLVASLAGVLCGVIAFRDLSDLSNSIDLFQAVGGSGNEQPMIGAGLIVVLIGAVLSIGGGLLFDPDKPNQAVKSSSISMR